MALRNGIINVGTAQGKELSFTHEAFDRNSYIWKKDDVVWLSMIIVKDEEQHKGHLKKLIETIESKGMRVKIPTPMGHMQTYLKKYGWKQTVEEVKPSNRTFEVEVWVRP